MGWSAAVLINAAPAPDAASRTGSGHALGVHLRAYDPTPKRMERFRASSRTAGVRPLYTRLRNALSVQSECAAETALPPRACAGDGWQH
eukprot:scaffold297884_cov39-Tisochrysis_lutea.AAC.1